MSKLGLNDEIANSLVSSFTQETASVIREIRQEYGFETNNFRHGGNWDTIFKRIKDVALSHDLVVLTKSRAIWTFVCALDLDTGSLYVFSKEKNLKVVMKNFRKTKIHYFHAFLSKNSDPKLFPTQQLTLFDIDSEEYEQKRLNQLQKILGDEYPHVKQVIFIVGDEINNKYQRVEARLYNSNFELIDSVDWSKFVTKDEYSDLTINPSSTEDEDNKPVIPKIKPQLTKGNNTIPRKKKYTTKTEEEANE